MNGALNEHKTCAKKSKLTQTDNIIINKKPSLKLWTEKKAGTRRKMRHSQRPASNWEKTPWFERTRLEKFWSNQCTYGLSHLTPRTSCDMDGRYGLRRVMSINRQFAELSANIKKFPNSLARGCALKPTDVSDDFIYSIECAIHLHQKYTIGCAYKMFITTRGADMKFGLF